jgi:hypothetical protein
VSLSYAHRLPAFTNSLVQREAPARHVQRTLVPLRPSDNVLYLMVSKLDDRRLVRSPLLLEAGCVVRPTEQPRARLETGDAKRLALESVSYVHFPYKFFE